VVLDDPHTGVAGALLALAAVGDVRAEALRVEAEVTAALGAGVSALLVGRAFTTHDGGPGVRSGFRVSRAGSASVLRDAVVGGLGGTAPPALGTPNGAGAVFDVQVSTSRQATGAAAAYTTVLVAVAPVLATPDAATALRVEDLVNASGVAETGRTLGFGCQVLRATRSTTPVDFLWAQDTSNSMDDDQENIGRAAVQFFARMRTVGLDFRVGVFESGSRSVDLDTPGYRWISGADPKGARALCEQVTIGRCPDSSTDALRPYPVLTTATREAEETSEFRLERAPVTSMLRVRVRNREVPRSRTEGFDYDPTARAVVFYGDRYRPATGDEVVVSYRRWESP
jgi:hypothetical protein